MDHDVLALIVPLHEATGVVCGSDFGQRCWLACLDQPGFSIHSQNPILILGAGEGHRHRSRIDGFHGSLERKPILCWAVGQVGACGGEWSIGAGDAQSCRGGWPGAWCVR
jgi:hypothetical protein